MASQRRLARLLAFQLLFELDRRGIGDLDEVLERRVPLLMEETAEHVPPGAVSFARRLVEGAMAHRDQIDATLARVAPAFPVESLAVTDRVALELATHELLCPRDVPVRVVINEAVELAKTYGGESSGRFVNGVLGTIAEELPDGGSAKTRQETYRRRAHRQSGRYGSMEQDSIEERLKRIVADQLGVDEAQVTREASFEEDLNADSLDLVELIMSLEEDFNIEISEDDAEKIHTVGDAIDYIREHKSE